MDTASAGSAAPATAAWGRSSRRTRISTVAAGAFCTFFLALGFLYPEASGRIASFAIAAVAAAALALGVRTLLDRRPILVVDGSGLTYRPFSTQVIPWSDITDVAIVRRHRLWVRFARRGFAHVPQMDTINFAVADPRRYGSRAAHALGRVLNIPSGVPPIAIQTWFVDASTDEIARAIRAHLPREIRQVDLESR